MWVVVLRVVDDVLAADAEEAIAQAAELGGAASQRPSASKNIEIGGNNLLACCFAN